MGNAFTKNKKCTNKDCDNPMYARSFCRLCYQRYYRKLKKKGEKLPTHKKGRKISKGKAKILLDDIFVDLFKEPPCDERAWVEESEADILERYDEQLREDYPELFKK